MPGQALRAPGCWELGGGGAESSLCLWCQGRCWMQARGVAVAWCTQTSDLHVSQSTRPCLSPPLSCGTTTVAFLIGSNVCTPSYLSKRWLVIQEMSTVIERKGDVPWPLPVRSPCPSPTVSGCPGRAGSWVGDPLREPGG